MGQRDGKRRTEADTEEGNREILPERLGSRYRMVAGFMVRKGRKDIAQAIMKEAYLDREQCREAGLSDFDLRIITNIFESR
jgi:hypothetical protein